MTDIEPTARPNAPVGVGVYERPRAPWMRNPAAIAAALAAIGLLVFATLRLTHVL